MRLYWFVMLCEEQYFRAKEEEAAIKKAKGDKPGRSAGTGGRGRVIDTRNMSSDELRRKLKDTMGKMVVEVPRG